MKHLTILFLICFSCSQQEQSESISPKQSHPYQHVKENLFVNPKSGEYYFSYSIPKRKMQGDSEIVTSHIIYDSLVLVQNEIKRISSILDNSTYVKSDSLDLFIDKNFVYEMRDENIIPKFKAIRR